jgi:hypothetical protein
MSSPIIMLEFNELTPALMDRFIAQGHLPGFKALRDRSIVCITDAEEDPPALEPWIQWVTVHTGLAFAEHGVYDLGDGEKFRAARIWDLVADAGKTAWVCGSMNGAVQTSHPQNVHLIPDPWAVDLQPLPPGLYDPFYTLVRTYVQQYTQDRPALSKADYAAFVRFMVANGLSLRTVTNALSQLAGERRGAPRWRRALILDRLLWDTFRAQWKRRRPAFSTFFLNSTAHFQHYYWRNMEPEKFALRDETDLGAADAILMGYKGMDRIVQECLDMVGDDATLVLATALGQQPLTKYDETGGKQIYKPRDATVLLRFAGYAGEFRYSPVMAEQFHLFFDTLEDAIDALAKLQALRMVDQPVMEARRDGKQIFAGCSIIQRNVGEAEITTPHANRAAAFDKLFYSVEGLKSGMHHPDGILWIAQPGVAPMTVARRVSLREIAPTIVALCGIDAPGQFALPPMPEVIKAKAEKATPAGRLTQAPAQDSRPSDAAKA